MLDRLDRLPDPQRTAVETAFGLSRGSPPDRFLVGLATLTLLSAVADERPLLCLVDDTQWIDRPSVQALTFAARRLVAEPVGLLFSARETGEEHGLGGLRDLAVRGLYRDDAQALLASVITGPMDDSVRERIVAETRGNPLALLELQRSLTTAQLAGGFGLPESGSLAGPIEQSYRKRIDALPPHTRRLMLVAAAEPVGDPALVQRAAQRLGPPWRMACSNSARSSGSGTPLCARQATGRLRATSGEPSIERSRTPRTRKSIPTAKRGTAGRRHSNQTRTSRPRSHVRPIVPGAAVDSQQAPRSSTRRHV
jgi:hypothetical protein